MSKTTTIEKPAEKPAPDPVGRVRWWGIQQAIGGGYRVIGGSAGVDELAPFTSEVHAPDMRTIVASKIMAAIETQPIPHQRDAPKVDRSLILEAKK